MLQALSCNRLSLAMLSILAVLSTDAVARRLDNLKLCARQNDATRVTEFVLSTGCITGSAKYRGATISATVSNPARRVELDATFDIQFPPSGAKVDRSCRGRRKALISVPRIRSDGVKVIVNGRSHGTFNFRFAVDGQCLRPQL